MNIGLKIAPTQPAQEPVAWMESPHGAIRANPLYRWTAPQSVAWSIPLYAGAAPAATRVLTDEQIAALTIMLDHFAGDPRTQCLRSLIHAAASIERAVPEANGAKP